MEISPPAPELALEPNDAAGDATGEAPAPAAKEPEAKATLGPGQAKSDGELQREAFVLLFASPDPLSEARLADLLERPDPERVRAACARISESLAAAGLPIVLQKIAGGWRFLTDPAHGSVLERLRASARPERISAAGLETLAIVAYRQPVTKAEIEAIRGVQAGPILRTLVDRGLVRVTGRADLPGSPLQYGTTREFLERFGLASLKSLPRDGELVEE
jgi:segregation and condensation protein B